MTTKVLLIRHAKPQNTSSYDDLVPISEEGRRIQKKMSEHLQAEGFSPDRIFHSPLLRAKETAEILSEVFDSPLQELDELGSFFNEEKLLALIPEATVNKTIFMVGHAPTLGLFANRLTGKNLVSDIERSGAIVLEFSGDIGFGKAQFVEYFSPRNLV